MRIQSQNTANELYDRLWKTKSARFNAYHRLNKTQYLSSYATSFLSVYVIVLALFHPYDIISEEKTLNVLNLIATCVSITLLVFVLMESSMQYNLKAEKFHDCAKKIGKLFKKFEFIKEDASLDETKKYHKYLQIQKKYNEIIDLYENHRPIDFNFFQSTNKLKKYNEDNVKFLWVSINLATYNRFRTKLKYNHLIYIHYYIVIFILPIILIWTISQMI
ncbi:SLATT domain-containing protein [Sphingobacterium sp. UBA6320]|uniref:SLATT domain-containing protein n=1 Tax=Sphingobacterium sp. UBA6320 TaxID=1947510 RepID=UPI0025D82679|nr:SLATT domain-containing protein [Sphingobacterium sp. UBA6320]